jgi:hypothetical protein
MALHKRTEFASLCGLSPGNISNYIKRGKIILSGDYIDDTIPENKTFLDKRKGTIVKLEIEREEDEENEIPNVQRPNKKTPPAPNVSNTDEVATYLSLDRIKKALDIEKITEEIQLLKIKKEKLHGEVLPTQLIKTVFIQHSASITTSFKDGIENLLLEISKTKGLSRNETAELRGKMIKIINTSVNDAVSMSQKLVKSIVSEFAVKKEVGEHD